MLPVGDQQLPFRGHAKASGDTCRVVINIDPVASSSSIKPNLEWPKGTILAARDSNVAVLILEGPKVFRFIFYCCQVAYVRFYKKTVPDHGLPQPKTELLLPLRLPGAYQPEGLAQHDCQSRCILCTGRTNGARGCTGKSRKPIKLSQPVPAHPASPPPHTPPQGHVAMTQPKSGSRSKSPAPPPATAEHFPPLAAPPQECQKTLAVVAAAATQDPSSALFPIQVPLDELSPIDPTLLIQDRLTGLEQRSLTRERALRVLPDLLIQRIGETIVPKIMAEVLKAVQIWAMEDDP
ncbi:hypothetical protein HPB49_017507 [Dermacentor silvarum]|uniref:Uncharacterized protein n=1 Tax=Dermacentor silvarum TaxID=543639 RepID=A0ACB8C4S0_DERSI|nr:hypothetical protein HPB49_017507 [Dermacentor silvarum]